jgi:CRISPR-associated endonuclease/helicase Cas3
MFPTLTDMERRLSQTLADLCANSEATVVNMARRRVLEECVRAADLPPGFFSLTVPTGGGKTYASLAFALRHALRHGLSRVIYALPFTAIIEQNAGKFRDALKDCAHGVVEHHSNLVVDDSDRVAKLAIENWEAPLVVTTNVQFFESLYSQRVSSCRKLHNLAHAVIILDEAQALPVSLLAPCLEALRELVTGYGATVVLCTATQPALNRRPAFEFGLEGVREIMPNTRALSEELRRVEVELLGQKTDDELGTLLREHSRVLCIVSTRRQARELFERIRCEEGTFHLSALMCPAHRSEVLDMIRRTLADPNAICRVVSTQLVEAGVDVDFPVVFRAMAGLDSIAQAAGRCNREGRLSRGKVYLFHGQQLPPAGFLRQTAQAADLILPQFAGDLLGLDAINAYFERYYWTQTGYMDRQDILARLNEITMRDLWIPFERVGRDFRIIRDEGLSVLIPYDETARDLLALLRHTGFTATLARKLQPYSVEVYPSDFEALRMVGAIDPVIDRCAVLIREDSYDPQTGLSQQISDVYNPEMLYSD